MIVTISGRPGAGKSVVARRVAEALGFDHLSAGDFMRDMARERGLSILELSRRAEGEGSIDREIDRRTAGLASERDHFVIDARLGWHFIPASFKVFLDVSPEVAAERVYAAGRRSEHENEDIAATRSALAARAESERQRYLEYYGLDYTDPSNYDLVVDTSSSTIDEVVDRVLAALAAHRTGPR